MRNGEVHPTPTPFIVSVIVQSGILVILCVGFTFTYNIEKFPNLAHVSVASIGTVIAFDMVRLEGYGPYQALPVSALACGVLGLALYFLVARPIVRMGSREITLTIASLAVALILETLVAVYSYWSLVDQRVPTAGFALKRYDFLWNDVPGVALVAPLICAFMVVSLYLFLRKSRFGIAIRATTEDEKLTAIFGIDTFKIHAASWFITGALAGLAGAIIPLWMTKSLGFSDELLIAVMAGSFVGGINSVYGAIVGGVLISIVKKGLPELLMASIMHGEPQLYEFAFPVRGFEQLMPILLIFVTLMLEPEGIMGLLKRSPIIIRKLKSIRKRLMIEFRNAQSKY